MFELRLCVSQEQKEAEFLLPRLFEHGTKNCDGAQVVSYMRATIQPVGMGCGDEFQAPEVLLQDMRGSGCGKEACEEGSGGFLP